MLQPVTFRPDPLSDPRALQASNRWWLALWVMLSSVVHGGLGLALPPGRGLPLVPARTATEVFDVEPPPPPAPPPLPPEPPAAPSSPPAVSPDPPAHSPQPRTDPEPPPRQAAALLTAADDAGPLDFTDGFVTGQATAFTGGATRSRGSNSRQGPSSNGVANAPSASSNQPSRDHSRRASVVGGFAWTCPFPPAADAAGIDLAVVQLKIHVTARGTLGDVGVLADPGHGFGAAARRCAADQRFVPALDRNAAPVAGEIVVRVRFTR